MGLHGILDVWDGIENFKETFSPGLTERNHADQPAQTPERLGEYVLVDYVSAKRKAVS
jgi:hypothetical protein